MQVEIFSGELPQSGPTLVKSNSEYPYSVDLRVPNYQAPMNALEAAVWARYYGEYLCNCLDCENNLADYIQDYPTRVQEAITMALQSGQFDYVQVWTVEGEDQPALCVGLLAEACNHTLSSQVVALATWGHELPRYEAICDKILLEGLSLLFDEGDEPEPFTTEAYLDDYGAEENSAYMGGRSSIEPPAPNGSAERNPLWLTAWAHIRLWFKDTFNA